VANEASGQSRARAGVGTWPVERARRAFGAASPGVEFAFPARLREWAALEVAAGRLLPWFAVSFGAGIVLYFTAEHEPAVWAASGLAAIGVAVAIFLRARPVGFVLALGFLAFAAGFAVATFKTALIAHPVLRYPAGNFIFYVALCIFSTASRGCTTSGPTWKGLTAHST
jgi:competence protein ComEC